MVPATRCRRREELLLATESSCLDLRGLAASFADSIFSRLIDQLIRYSYTILVVMLI